MTRKVTKTLERLERAAMNETDAELRWLKYEVVRPRNWEKWLYLWGAWDAATAERKEACADHARAKRKGRKHE